MENVSKALIIAGAILLAILLITIGIFILNSQNSTTDEAFDLLEAMELEASDTADIIAGYTVNRYANRTIDIVACYSQYHTGIKIDEDATYILSFDYTIEEKEVDIGCGVGFYFLNPAGNYAQYVDGIYGEPYPNQNIGEKTSFTITFKPKGNSKYNDYKNKDLYLGIRFVRHSGDDTPRKSKVKIENIKLKYK